MDSDLYVKEISKTRLAIYTKKNNHKIGTIDTVTRTLRCVKRTYKNLFRLFGDGLGLNAELLMWDNYDIIEVPYNGEILTTTRKKWLSRGIPSPYVSEKIDHQLILRLKDLNMVNTAYPEPKSIKPQSPQLNLFC